VFNWIKVELQGVQQALNSIRAVSTAPLPLETPELGDEPAQLHRIADTVEACLRQTQAETTQATQSLVQVQKDLEDQCSTTKWENRSLQEKWDEEKTQLQQRKGHFLTEQLEVKEMVNIALLFVIVFEVKTEERVPQ
jgi:hypothetical protein